MLVRERPRGYLIELDRHGVLPYPVVVDPVGGWRAKRSVQVDLDRGPPKRDRVLVAPHQLVAKSTRHLAGSARPRPGDEQIEVVLRGPVEPAIESLGEHRALEDQHGKMHRAEGLLQLDERRKE